MRRPSLCIILGVVTVSGLGSTCGTARAVFVTPVATDPLLRGAFGITTDGSNLFVTSNSGGNGRVVTVPVGGGAVTPLYSGLSSPLGIATIGTNVFWIDPNSGPFTDPQILSAPKGGGGPVTAIYTGSNLPSPHPVLDGSGLTTDGSHLFWSDEVGGFVFRINTDGSGVTQIGPMRYSGGFSTEHLNTIAYRGNTLYVADSGRSGVTPPSVLAIPTAGGSFSTLFAGSPFVVPTGIAVSDDTIFISDGGAKSIWSLPIAGGTPTLLTADPRFGNLANLTYLNGSLYVTDNGTSTAGTIWRVDLVPEPSSSALLGLACLGVAAFGGLRSRTARGPQCQGATATYPEAPSLRSVAKD